MHLSVQIVLCKPFFSAVRRLSAHRCPQGLELFNFQAFCWKDGNTLSEKGTWREEDVLMMVKL